VGPSWVPAQSEARGQSRAIEIAINRQLPRSGEEAANPRRSIADLLMEANATARMEIQDDRKRAGFAEIWQQEGCVSRAVVRLAVPEKTDWISIYQS